MTKINIGDKVKFRRIEENIYDREGIVRSVQEVELDKLYYVECIDELGKKQFTVVPENRVVIASQTDNDMVNHPGHYNVQGRKECIDEMIEKHGIEATYWFCVLNSDKYAYRKDHKGQTELDEQKIKWYTQKAKELLPQIPLKNRLGHISPQLKYIADYYGYEDQIDKLKEEVEELRCAIDDYRTDETADRAAHLWEEAADVAILLQQLLYLADETDCNMFKAMMEFKVNRQLARIEEEKRYWNDPF